MAMPAPATASWCKVFKLLARNLAQQVSNHQQPLSAGLGVPEVDYVISPNQTDCHFEEIVKVLKLQGKLALIDDPEPIDVRLLKRKSLSLHWELMFTRSLYATGDMVA